jgi:hypothetical protein
LIKLNGAADLERLAAPSRPSPEKLPLQFSREMERKTKGKWRREGVRSPGGNKEGHLFQMAECRQFLIIAPRPSLGLGVERM